ncbi:Uncharacterized protein HZ326_26764, partial [Fusarium oxysporum f. sp. albedinis]
FDKYNGPVFLTTPDGKKIVPILSVERDFLIGATFCARTQFPLIVCYAITVHKSQSITEDMIVTDLSCQDFQTGLSYVAVSRVETLEGLMLEAPFDRNDRCSHRIRTCHIIPRIAMAIDQYVDNAVVVISSGPRTHSLRLRLPHAPHRRSNVHGVTYFKSIPIAAKVAQSKKPTRFALGGSCSSSEQDQSFGNSKSSIPIIKKPVCQIGDSSEEDGSMKSAMASSRPNPLLSARKKQASFSNNVMTRTIDDQAAVDSDTDDYIDESAIDDDDDSSDWEDAMGESGKSSMDHKFFQRVDSKPNLTSRRSLITLMFAENDRARNLGNHASHSTSAILRSRTAHGLSLGASRHDSDAAPLMMKGKRLPGLKPIHVPRPNAQTIMTGPQHIQPQAALSPRTTRRNMLGTELTESLRRHLLWERQVKSSTANAVLKRRHTSHGVADLKQYPEKSCMKKSEDVNASSWNRYFSKEATDGYHSKGW